MENEVSTGYTVVIKSRPFFPSGPGHSLESFSTWLQTAIALKVRWKRKNTFAVCSSLFYWLTVTFWKLLSTLILNFIICKRFL